MSRFCCCVDSKGTAYVGIAITDYLFAFSQYNLSSKYFEYSAKATYLQDKLRHLHIGPEQMIFSNEAAQKEFYSALDVEAKQNTYDN